MSDRNLSGLTGPEADATFHARAVVLVEGISDQRALEALAGAVAGISPLSASRSCQSGVRRRSEASWIGSALRG